MFGGRFDRHIADNKESRVAFESAGKFAARSATII